MESLYSPVQTEEYEDDNKINWKYLLRQTFISSGPWSMFFIAGLCFGTPTVMIPQLRKEANSTEYVDEVMASWLSSVFGYAGLPWVFVIPTLSEIYGRKAPYYLIFTLTAIGFITWYFSTTVISVLIAEISVSIIICSCMTHGVVIVVEYSSPKYRGVFLGIKSATFYWGLWVGNIIGAFFHWKNIMILGLFCIAYNILSIIWPQSPHWLATQGRFEECAASHRWLKGTSLEAELELKQLIVTQKTFLNEKPNRQWTYSCRRFLDLIKVFSFKIVYKPILVSLISMALYLLSGKLACNMYAIEILKKVTGQESTAYKGMLILDAVSILGMYFGCYLAKILRRRTLLFSTTSCAVLVLFTLSLYLYLIKLSCINDTIIVSLILLTLYSMSISCGPMVLASSIVAELLPLKYKGTAIIGLNICINLILSTVLKISPFIFKATGLHGGFLFYGICSLVCIIILYKYLPETKDKSLIDIEEYFNK